MTEIKVNYFVNILFYPRFCVYLDFSIIKKYTIIVVIFYIDYELKCEHTKGHLCVVMIVTNSIKLMIFKFFFSYILCNYGVDHTFIFCLLWRCGEYLDVDVSMLSTYISSMLQRMSSKRKSHPMKILSDSQLFPCQRLLPTWDSGQASVFRSANHVLTH